MSKILWIDTETTGLDAKIHGLREIACIVEIDGVEVERFELFLDYESCKNREIYISKYVKENMLKKHDERILIFPYIYGYIELIDKLSKHINIEDKKDRFIMAGYNVDFDSEFIKQLFIDHDGAFKHYFSYQQIDVLAFARSLGYAGCFETKNYKLETLCNKFNIPIDAHSAISDILATRALSEELFSRYIKVDSDEDS